MSADHSPTHARARRARTVGVGAALLLAPAAALPAAALPAAAHAPATHVVGAALPAAAPPDTPAAATSPTLLNAFQSDFYSHPEVRRGVTAQLWDRDAAAALVGVEVVFTVDDLEYRETTDHLGVALAGVDAPAGATVTVAFPGSATHAAATDTVVLTEETPWPVTDVGFAVDQGTYDADVRPVTLRDALHSTLDELGTLPGVQFGVTTFGYSQEGPVLVRVPATAKRADVDDVFTQLAAGDAAPRRGIDAIYGTLYPGMARTDSTKCVVLATTAPDTASDNDVNSAISALREWPAKLFAVVDAGPDGADYRRIAEASGGVAFDAAAIQDDPAPLVAALKQRCDARVTLTADLGVTVTDGLETVRPGEQVTATVVVTNSGPIEARYAGAVLSLPAEMDILFASDSGELHGHDDVTTVTWDLAEIPAGESRTLQVVYRVPDDAADGTAIEARVEAHHVDVEIEPTPEDTLAYDSTTVVADPPPATLGLWYLTNALAGDPHEISEGFAFGPAATEVYLGDWDGDGVDTPAHREDSTFFVRNSNTPGDPDASTAYGRAGDVVYVGDWDGDGVDTFAVRRGNEFLVSNDFSGGEADVRFWYGRADDEVFVGDWDGDGKDTIAIRRGNAFHVRNTLTTGNATQVFWYGRPGETVLVGDWDGNGTDTIAIRRGDQVHVNNALTSGNATRVTVFATDADHVLVGDIDGDGTDTLGVYLGISSR